MIEAPHFHLLGPQASSVGVVVAGLGGLVGETRRHLPFLCPYHWVDYLEVELLGQSGDTELSCEFAIPLAACEWFL